MSIEEIIPEKASPAEVAVILLNHLHPEWSKKQIAAVVRYKNHHRPRAVQRIFQKYHLSVVQVKQKRI